MDHSIGAVARLAGVSVKTVRYYSDLGLLESRRTAAGHRRYDADAVARLGLIRTLRALGIDVPTIRAVLNRERTLSDTATAHAGALAIQIRALRRQHALLTVLAQRQSTPEDLELMHDLTALSEQDRQALIADFLTSTLGDDPALAAVRQNLTPVLSDDALPEQVEAWLELAALIQDDDFRASLRRLAAGYRVLAADGPLWHDAELRGRLTELGRTEADPRWPRYLELLADVNGWSRLAG